MASTAHKTEAELAEHHDDPATLAAKLDTLAAWVTQAAHFSAFTGAGISTAAGIPDFRGPNGVWTLRAKGQAVKARHHEMLGCRPTRGHLALCGLAADGRLAHLISTNTDGLHLRSGFPTDKFTELHGNTNCEGCPEQPVGSTQKPYGGGGCGQMYYRDERARPDGLGAHEHATGRQCEQCGGDLQDTIISFNENLWPANVARARRVVGQTDLMLALGSSLRVSAWAPQAVAAAGKLVICNLQWTPLDEVAALKIHARADEVLEGLCERLAVPIPGFVLSRSFSVRRVPGSLMDLRCAEIKSALRAVGGMDQAMKGAEKGELVEMLEATGHAATRLEVRCTDGCGTPYSWMTKAEIADRGNSPLAGFLERRALKHSASVTMLSLKDEAVLRLGLSGRFDEPPIVVPASELPAAGEARDYLCSFDVEAGGEWTVEFVLPN